jgi:hypothetical protein
MFSSYLTRTFVCRIVVKREINSAFDVGMDSSTGGEREAAIEVGELGAEPEAGFRLREERVLTIFVAFLSAVRKSSTGGIVRERKKIWKCAPTFAERIPPL